MAELLRVEGLDRVLDNLNREVKGILFRTKKGMIKAGLFIQRESQKIVPVDLGNLKNSAFTVWGPGSGNPSGQFDGPDAGKLSGRHSAVVTGEGMSLSGSEWNPQVEIGYSAAYAVYVHENTLSSHVKSKSGAVKGALRGVSLGSVTVWTAAGGDQAFDATQIGEAKFLEKAVDRNQGKILTIIKTEGKIK